MITSLAIVPARGGSKGIPMKNIAPCGGKPLLQWTFDALAESSVDQVVLSSDSPIILDSAPSGVIRHLRPAELATDEASTEVVIDDVLQSFKADIILLLQPTSPLRTPEQIDLAIGMLISQRADSLVSVCPSHALLWHFDGEKGNANYYYNQRPRRQELQTQFEENGSIYAFTWAHWQRTHNRLGGNIAFLVMPEQYRWQVDSFFDLWLLDQILTKRDAWKLT